MFAMLCGGWPRVREDGTDLATLEADVAAGRATPEALAAAVDALVQDAVRAQEDAGLDLVTDGQVRWPDAAAAVLGALAGGDTGDDGLLARAWRATAALTEHVVAQAVPGPYSLGRRGEPQPGSALRRARTLELADGLAGELAALAAAGCPVVLVEEPAAVLVGDDAQERELFLAAQARLLARAPEVHAMLAVTGGSAWAAGVGTILGAPYRSFLFDLVAGPDNWHLVRATAGDRGIVCAALDATSPEDPAPLLSWAARYAAASNGRGMERVGIANATPLTDLPPEAARSALGALGRAARLAAMPPAEAVAAGLDARTFAQPEGRRLAPRRTARGTDRTP